MGFNPLAERGIPIDRQLRNWSELNISPYSSQDIHPYSRCRVIAMNGIEVEAIMNSHQTARHTADLGLKQQLATVRRVEQQQQQAVNWLIPGDQTTLEVTIGYEQVAVDLTEILPGRPTIFQHRDPVDDILRPMTLTAADTQSVLNALTITSAEQQTMNFYMNVGNRPTHPLARGLYLEIAQIEEQHVSHYESILDPTMGWLYWSWMHAETDKRLKALWESHLNMEIEHLRIACDAMRAIEGVEPESFLPEKGIAAPMTFEPNKDYIRDVLLRTVEWTGFDARFVDVADLPADHRFFAYQKAVNVGGTPTEHVIEQRREHKGADYRHPTEGQHPVSALTGDGTKDRLQYAQRVTPHLEGVEA